MIVTSLLSFALLSSPSPMPVPAPACVVLDEVEERIAAAGEDVEKILALAASLKEEDNRDGMRAAYKRVLEIDDANKKAHKGLRHHFYDGKWFDSYAKLSKYRRAEAKMMKEK